jgi:hypothetical protein
MPKQAAAMFRESGACGQLQIRSSGKRKSELPTRKQSSQQALQGSTFDMGPFTIHDQRRTASTLLRENGWDANVVKKVSSREKDGIAGIHDRAEYAMERKKMLQWCASHVDFIITERASAIVRGSIWAHKLE